MSEYDFGLGRGQVSRREAARVAKIAKVHGADFTTHYDAACNCGYGCRPHTCPQSARYWFSVPNRGHPFDGQVERVVLAAVGKVAVKTR